MPGPPARPPPTAFSPSSNRRSLLPRLPAPPDGDLPSANAPQPSLPPALPAIHDITFEDVYFAYDGGQRPALRGLQLHIPHGQTLALVGPTGAGKTTIANLLLRFIEPQAGRITVGGAPLATIAPEAWRAQLAWVPQHPHLFHGNVAENIALAHPHATSHQIEEAARAANAHEFILALPQGYETPIGEQGARLSGGQRQRLAIARAFSKTPQS